MSSRRRLSARVLCALVASFTLSSSLAWGTLVPSAGYTFQDLGVPLTTYSRARDINNAGQVAIEAGGGNGTTAVVRWSAAEGFVVGGRLGTGDYATAVDISTNGTITGGSRTSTSIFSVNGFTWRQGPGFTDTGRAPWANSNNFASGISDNAQYVSGSGYRYDTQTATYSQLLPFTGTSNPAVSAVNNAGTAVGSAAVPAQAGFGGSRATAWKLDGSRVNLGIVYDDPTRTNDTSLAVNINNAGTIVGYSGSATGFSRGFLWTETGGAVDLGALFGRSSFPTDLNEFGLIVGYASNTSQQRAIVWDNDPARTAYDLNLLTTGLSTPAGNYLLAQSWGVNDLGQIVGSATFTDAFTLVNTTRAFLLTPIPEPTALALFVPAMLTLRRRR